MPSKDISLCSCKRIIQTIFHYNVASEQEKNMRIGPHSLLGNGISAGAQLQMLCMPLRLGTWHCWILIQDARMSHGPCHINWCLAMFGNQPSMMTVDEYGWNEQLGFSTKLVLLNIVNTDVQFIFWIMTIMTFSVASGMKLDRLSSSPHCLPRIWKCDKVLHLFTRLGKVGNHNSYIDLHRNTLHSQIYWFKIIYVVAGWLFPF